MFRNCRPAVIRALVPIALGVAGAACDVTDVLLVPKTLVDRAIEARSADDIATDNRIVLEANRLMAEIGSISASTTIYEQRLLVTGLFSDRADYRKFSEGVRAIDGVKKLYWHAAYMSDADQRKNAAKILPWADVLILQSKAEARLIGTRGVADVNFRVSADSFGTLYLLGRARSNAEMRKALARVRDGDGVRKVVNYAVMRP